MLTSCVYHQARGSFSWNSARHQYIIYSDLFRCNLLGTPPCSRPELDNTISILFHFGDSGMHSMLISGNIARNNQNIDAKRA